MQSGEDGGAPYDPVPTKRTQLPKEASRLGQTAKTGGEDWRRQGFGEEERGQVTQRVLGIQKDRPHRRRVQLLQCRVS